VQVHVVERETFPAVTVGVALLHTLHALWPDRFAWRGSAGRFFVDRLAGTARLREAVDASVDPRELERSWEPGLQAFERQAENIRLYAEGAG
jgi:uncharacterized protein YbbC (DUF1343 family)